MPIARFLPLLLILALAPLTGAHADDEDALRAELEGIYDTWRQAVLDRDAESWQTVTAAYTRMNIRNTIVSQKLAFPDALFDAPIRPPSLEGLKFLGARAVKNTAQAIYFGKIDFGIAPATEAGGTPREIPDNLLVLRFIREQEWKFDTTRLLSLEGADDVKKQIAAGDNSFLDDEAFTPPGDVPPVAKPCKTPERIGHLQIVSIGYETEITINRGSKHLIADTAASELIIGGLHAGPNHVLIHTRPIPVMAGDEPRERQFQIRILSLDDRAAKKPLEILRYEPDEAPPSYEAHVRGVPN